MKEFIDTNVLLYSLDSSSAKQRAAVALLSGLWARQEGHLSVQVLQEAYVNLVKKLRVSPTDALSALQPYAAWTVYSPTAADVFDAARLHRAAQLSFWDAMMVLAASRLGCDVIWSEDLNDGQVIAGVTVRNPF